MCEISILYQSCMSHLQYSDLILMISLLGFVETNFSYRRKEYAELLTLEKTRIPTEN